MLNNYKIFHKDQNVSVSSGYVMRSFGNLRTIFGFYKINIKIVGKIFRWYFSKRKIRFVLNRSHSNILYFNNNFKMFKLNQGKYDSDLLTLGRVNVDKFHYFIKYSRSLNIFTKRGVFVNKHYNNKLGKISSYV